MGKVRVAVAALVAVQLACGPEHVAPPPGLTGPDPAATVAPEGPGPAKPADGAARTEQGGCGTIQAARVAGPFDRPLIDASPLGQVLVYVDGDDALVFDTRSGRTSRVRGHVVAFSSDEQAALVAEQGPAGAGTLTELMVATGALRALAATFSTRVAGTVAVLETTAGETLRYDLVTRELRTMARARSGQPRIFQVFGERVLTVDGIDLVLWDPATGQLHRAGPAQAALLIESGRAVVYVDPAGQARGWAPPHPPVALGTQRADRLSAALRGGQSEQRGYAVFVTEGGHGFVWNIDTNAVRDLGPGVKLTSLISKEGVLLFTRATAGGDEGIVVDADTGASVTLSGWLPRSTHVALSADGLRAAAGFLEGEEPVQHLARLWDATTGAVIPLEPEPPRNTDQLQVAFRARDRLLQVSAADLEDALYSTTTGARVYVTRRTVIPAEGHYFLWSDDVFFMRQGAYLGPPEAALHAWDVTTREETALGERTDIACLRASRILYRAGVDDPYLYGRLLRWEPGLDEAVELSARATSVECLAATNAAVFIEDETGAALQPAGSVVYTDFATGCRQRLAGEATQKLVHEGLVLVSGPGGVERVTLPR